MKNDRSRYYGHRFPPEIISYAVWVYHRFCLSFRDVEDLLAERGIIVSYEALFHARVQDAVKHPGHFYGTEWLTVFNPVKSGLVCAQQIQHGPPYRDT